MHVLLAFDKFKDSLTAPEACQIVARELHNTPAKESIITTDICPLADGGEGFASILTTSVQGELETMPAEGPRRATVEANLGFVPLKNLPPAARARLALPHHLPAGATVAIIEMASASGLALLPSDQRDPWQTSSRGTGQLIRLATERNVSAILLGVGGSATSDLGLGALGALGFSFHNAAGESVDPIPAHWPGITGIRGHAARNLPPIRIACDVSNPLLGPRGAAAVYGLQKGLRVADLPRLETESSRLAHLLCDHVGQSIRLADLPGAGAAGGIAFGLMTATGAQLIPGFELITDWLDLEARITRADVVITGEGRFDDTSLQGKGPGAVAARALALGKSVHVFAGQIRPPVIIPDNLYLHAITPAAMPLSEALRAAPELLAHAVRLKRFMF